MSEIWVVNSGNKFDDFDILGVFDSKEAAQTFVDLWKDMPDPYGLPVIESSYILNELNKVVELVNGGNHRYDIRLSPSGIVQEIVEELYNWTIKNEMFLGRRDIGVFSVWAKNEEEAIEVAQIMRKKAIESGEWKVK